MDMDAMETPFIRHKVASSKQKALHFMCIEARYSIVSRLNKL